MPLELGAQLSHRGLDTGTGVVLIVDLCLPLKVGGRACHVSTATCLESLVGDVITVIFVVA